MADEKQRIRQRSEKYKVKRKGRDKRFRLRHPGYSSKYYVSKRPKGWVRKTAGPDYWAKQYQKNKGRIKAYQKEYRIAKGIKPRGPDRRKINQTFVKNYKKDKCCAFCSWYGHPIILHFHHHKGIKGESIAYLISHGSLNQIKQEIKKCILLCPNCHAWFHRSKKNL